MTDSTKESTIPETNLYKNKSVIRGITLILTEIIEENQIDQEKKKALEKKTTSKINTVTTSSSNKASSNVNLKTIVNNEPKNNFTAKKIPGIALDIYIERILKYSNIEESTLIIVLIYIDRLCENTGIKMSMYNIHRLLLTSTLVAIKYNEDDYYSNTHYGKIGGISLPEINTLEEDFIDGLNWQLWIVNELYEKYSSYLKHYQTLERKKK
jgi:hypothetical protein